MTSAADVVGVALLLALGLAVGSFLNVVVWRVPRGESVVSPASRCPSCGAAIRARDNVPVVGWLVLRGRCRDCRAEISPRYPLVEAATGAVFVVLWAAIGWDWALPAFLYLGAAGIALALIDIDVKRLPNAIVLPSYPLALGLLAVPALVDGEHHAYVRALLGGVALFAGYFAVAFIAPRGMGMGDVKLAGVLGIYLGWLGWPILGVGSFLAFLIGGVLGSALLLTKLASRKTKIPFGPFMLLGALVAVLVGDAIADGYADLLTGA